jgi:hypothetical protein
MDVGYGGGGFKTDLCHFPITSFKSITGNANLYPTIPILKPLECTNWYKQRQRFL